MCIGHPCSAAQQQALCQRRSRPWRRASAQFRDFLLATVAAFPVELEADRCGGLGQLRLLRAARVRRGVEGWREPRSSCCTRKTSRSPSACRILAGDLPDARRLRRQRDSSSTAIPSSDLQAETGRRRPGCRSRSPGMPRLDRVHRWRRDARTPASRSDRAQQVLFFSFWRKEKLTDDGACDRRAGHASTSRMARLGQPVLDRAVRRHPRGHCGTWRDAISAGAGRRQDKKAQSRARR